MSFRIYPSRVVSFSKSERTITVKVDDGWPFPENINLGDPSEITPNPRAATTCDFCGGTDGYPGNHGPECPCNLNREMDVQSE